MRSENLGLILALLTFLFLLILPFANKFYQKRAENYWENMLKSNPLEYNRQIKSNANTKLFRGILGGLFFWLWFVLNFQSMTSHNTLWFLWVLAIFGIGSFIWGVWGYKKELKKLIELN